MMFEDVVYEIAKRFQDLLDNKDLRGLRALITEIEAAIAVAEVFQTKELQDLRDLREAWYELVPILRNKICGVAIKTTPEFIRKMHEEARKYALIQNAELIREMADQFLGVDKVV